MCVGQKLNLCLVSLSARFFCPFGLGSVVRYHCCQRLAALRSGGFRSRNFQFSTDLSKTAWCCELTIFLAKTKRFLRQSKPKFSTYTELRSFAKLPVICSAFCSVGLEICRSSGGKFILFWRRAKDGREKLFCSLWFCGGWSGLQMCFSLCVGLFCLFCDEGCKKYKIGLEFYK